MLKIVNEPRKRTRGEGFVNFDLRLLHSVHVLFVQVLEVVNGNTDFFTIMFRL